MTQELDPKALRKVAEQATPGPWHWSGNTKTNQLYLATWIKGAGRCQVMDFVRWGMHSAAPRFLDDESLMMQSAKDLVVYEVARNQGLPDETPSSDPRVYRQDVVDVRHPNARFLAAANPEAVLALLTQLEQAEAQVTRVREMHEEYVICEWDQETNFPKHDANGKQIVLARLCRACSSDDSIAAAEDAEWDDSYSHVEYPCPTILALDGEPNE